MKTSWTVEAAAIVLGVGSAGICLLGVGLLADPSGKAAPPPPAAGSVALQLCSPANSSGSVADSIVSSRDADRYPMARTIYTSVLNDDPRDRCAAEGLASLVAAEAESARPGTWIGRWSQSWSSTLKNWWQPLAAPLGAALGVAVLLVVVSWLLTPVLVRPDTSVAVGDRRASRLGAVLLVAVVGAACVLQSMVRQAHPDPRLLMTGLATVAAAAIAVIQVTTWRTPDARRHERRHGPLLVGLAAMGAAAWVLVVTGFSAWCWLWCLGASLVAVVWVATSRGGRLAVSVTVRKDNKASDDSAQLLLARLSQLGSQPPKGIHGSPQTDVSALPDEAFTAVPGGAVAGTVFTLLRLVRSGVPWSFDVVLHGDDTVSWQTRRNGVSTENGVTVFTLADLGIAAAPTHDSQASQSLPAQQAPLGAGSSDQPQSRIPRNTDDCLLTCAAAALLLTLSQAHPELKRGLCNAERWETVATYTLAMTAPRASSARSALLRKAQLIEPEFGLAAFAAAYVLPVSSLAQRQRFARELRRLFGRFPVPFPQPLEALDSSVSERVSDEPRPGWEALHLRLLHGNAAAWLNVALLTQAGAPGEDLNTFRSAWENSAEAAVALVDRLAVTIEQQDLKSISTALRVPTYYIVADLQSLRPFDHKTFDAGARVVSNRLTRLSPLEAWTMPATATDYFARAAYFAAKPSGTTFLDDLETALSRPGFRDGFDSDPSFANLLDPPPDPDPLQGVRVRFKALMGNPGLTSYLELPPFVPWSAQLLASGFAELTDLAPLPPALLASRLKVPHTVAQQWSDLAQLAARMLLEPPQDLSAHDLEVLALLVECRVTSIEDLHRSLSQDPERLYADLVTAARRRQVVPTREATIARWIDLCKHP